MDRDIFTESHSLQGGDAPSEQLCASEAPLLFNSLSGRSGGETQMNVPFLFGKKRAGEESTLTDAWLNVDCFHGDDARAPPPPLSVCHRGQERKRSWRNDKIEGNGGQIEFSERIISV